MNLELCSRRVAWSVQLERMANGYQDFLLQAGYESSLSVAPEGLSFNHERVIV